jgi:hypothetical protein
VISALLYGFLAAAVYLTAVFWTIRLLEWWMS